jgi:hypothetical protein
MDDLITRLTETAAGSWGHEAAVWLLAEHGHWLPELARLNLIDYGADDASIRWDAIRSTALPCSGSEFQVLDLARALASNRAAALTDLTSLDEPNRRLVLTAIAWAAGGSDWAWSLRLAPAEVRLRGRARDSH